MAWFASNDERRARLGARHGLAAPVETALEAARAVTGLHSSDPATVYLSIRARAAAASPADISSALYEERSLVRIYGMRRTLWVVDRETHPLVEHSSTARLRAPQRRRLEKMVEDSGIAEDGQAWLTAALERTERVVVEEGPILARDLGERAPTEKLMFHNRRGELIGATRASTRILTQLALESRVIRADPVGTWVSSQYRWSGMEQWLGGPIPSMAPDRARAELLRRWLGRFGPATEVDMRWWTGWTAAQTRRALVEIGAVEVGLPEGPGYVNADDAEAVPPAGPWAALLPSLDPTVMGWKERGWYLGDHAGRLFDRNGNAGPTVWVDGRVVGGWSQRKTGEVAYGLLEDVGAERAALVEAEAARLQDWLDDVVVTPRFATPFDKALRS